MKEYLAPEMTVYLFRTEDVLGPSDPTPGEDEGPIAWKDNFGA